MNIVNLIQLEAHKIFAATNNGHIMCWTIPSPSEEGEPLLVESFFHDKLVDEILGLQQSFCHVIMYNKEMIIFKRKDELKYQQNQLSFDQWMSVKATEEQIIAATQLNGRVFVGIANNQLIKLNLKKMQVQKYLKLLRDNSLRKIKFGRLFSPQIVAVASTKNEDRIVVGMSHNIFYIVDACTMNIVSFLESKVNEPIVSIHISEIQNVIWVCHQSWVIGLKEGASMPVKQIEKEGVTQVLSLPRPEFMMIMIGDYPWFDVIRKQDSFSAGLSMRRGTCLKLLFLQKKELTFVGGSDGLVDVFEGAEHKMVLSPSLLAQ